MLNGTGSLAHQHRRPFQTQCHDAESKTPAMKNEFHKYTKEYTFTVVIEYIVAPKDWTKINALKLI